MLVTVKKKEIVGIGRAGLIIVVGLTNQVGLLFIDVNIGLWRIVSCPITLVKAMCLEKLIDIETGYLLKEEELVIA